MERTLLALAVASLSASAFASPPPGGGPPTPIEVTVKNASLSVIVSNPATNPVNVAVVDGNSSQAVNAKTLVQMEVGQYIETSNVYANETDFPVNLTYVGIAAGQTFCQVWPTFIEANVKTAAGGYLGGPFGGFVNNATGTQGYCQYSGVLPASIAVPPGAVVYATVIRAGDANTSQGFTFVLSGYSMQ
jgi:hypothetical protein